MSSTLSSSVSMTSADNRRGAMSPRRPSSMQDEAPPPETLEVTETTWRLISHLKALFVLSLLLFLYRGVFIPRTHSHPKSNFHPSERHCFVVHGLLYCNHDCLPRYRKKHKLEVFTMLRPNKPTYIVGNPLFSGQFTKYCISHEELDVIWLAAKLHNGTTDLARLKRGHLSHEGKGMVSWLELGNCVWHSADSLHCIYSVPETSSPKLVEGG